MLEQWLVVVTVLLGPQERHPTVFELTTLLAAAKEINSSLRAQAVVQQDMPAALVRIIQTDYNESFHQAFTSHLPVRWPHFNPLIRNLATLHFHLGTVAMPVGFQHSLPTSVAANRSAAPPHKTSTSPYQVGEAHTALLKATVQKPAPLPHLHVGPGFRLQQSMEHAAKISGMPVPQTYNGRPFCLSYHL